MSAETEQLTTDPALHVVQFYRCDDELVDSVSGYLAEGLEAGATAIVVAAAAHRAGVRARMATACDVAGARARGDFVVLDAAEMMRLFLIGDRPDPGGFDLVIGGLIRRAVAAGRPVRVYGEMVALLWDAGHINAAIELETLWDELGRGLPFSLLCGYPAQSVSGTEHADALQQICHLHAATIGVPPKFYR
jgi:MEDS: MEthanogen/methylotroph, DcmR Sensory domain